MTRILGGIVTLATWPEHRDNDTVCAFIIGNGAARRACGRSVRTGSAYCPEHHALCHVGGGTTEEISRLLEVELIANAVGGRRGPGGAGWLIVVDQRGQRLDPLCNAHRGPNRHNCAGVPHAFRSYSPCHFAGYGAFVAYHVLWKMLSL